jgi:transcriptional regulator with XRE-family HTH domain
MDTATGLTMPANSEKQLSDEQSRAVAARVREELARRRISRQHLADQAKISISTLEKALAGRRPFTLATTVRLEEALGVSLRKGGTDSAVPPPAPAITLAPGDLGFYSRPSVSFVEGVYLTIRPSFGEPGSIYAYQTEICWDAETSNLVFRESERVDADFAQQGRVAVPNQSGYIYLVTNRLGQYRLVLVCRPTIYGEMFGIMTTLRAGRGAELIPVSAPIAYVPLKKQANAEFGRIPTGHPCYERYRKYLKRTVEEPFAIFLSA